MMTFPDQTALEFFAGIGLVKMGLERAGWRVVYANDIDPKKQQMHEGHWGADPNYHRENVWKVAPSDVPSAELAWASFPCVDLSLAGNRAGLAGEESGAYWGFHRILAAKTGDERPPLVVLENVVGMLTSHGGRDLETILLSLNELGYQVDLLQVDAAHFVPQSRPRLFVIGVAAPYELPAKVSSTPTKLQPEAVVRFIKAHQVVHWGDVPTGPLPLARPTLEEVLEWFPSDADIWWPSEARDRLVAQMSPRHMRTVEAFISSDRKVQFTVYRRVRHSGCMAEVRSDGVAGCLRTPRGGSSRQFVMEAGGGELRARHMTAVEYGRLQGAGGFRITVPEIQALFGFGDAVCVPAVEWLVRETLGRIRQGTREEIGILRPRLLAEAR